MDKISTFWDFSLATYSRPDVAEACLSLQDQYALDVNMLLFCCWYGSTRGCLNKDIFKTVIAFSESWATQVVHPLRNTRKWMKHPNTIQSYQHNSKYLKLRNEIKKSELSAERIQQETLEDLASTVPINLEPQEQTINAIKNLWRYLEYYDVRLDPPSLVQLAHIITSFVNGSDKKNVLLLLKKNFKKG
jgi:uncharacterized protein (TIGR02444 family)